MDDEVRTRLEQMLSYAELAVKRANGLSIEEFTQDPLLYEGFIRLVQNVGEAAFLIKRTHPDTLAQIDLPWTQMIGMRHRLVHAYSEIIPAIVLTVIQEELPPITEKLSTILEPSE